MKKLLKPASIVFYLLSAFVFFIVGLYLAGILGAGKNQGLAGGAIVLGYGVLTGGLAFIISFFIAYHVVHKWVVRLNWILFVLLLIGYGVTHYRYVQRNQKDAPSEKEHAPLPTTEPMAMLAASPPTTTPASLPYRQKATPLKSDALGLGFFKHNFYDHPTCYFYGNINWEKGLAAHIAQDSIALVQDQSGGFSLRSAPPYLLPEYHETIHGEFYFKVIAEGYDFVKVEVNHTTQQLAYLNKNNGRLYYWPEFLLQRSAVSMLPDHQQPLRLKPLANAGTQLDAYTSLRPIAVQEDWLQVAVQNSKQQTIHYSWIRWRDSEKMLISFDMDR
ncbi:hypothetical protein [Altibacter sp. HG106]|uniref:hypothetical protein n=1 Tax=Altibacter sp. HG106 TaxID=3023937 RepID=UPI002350541F|nr:hypothetical protein [Altibacter sp. HG106]MDC7995471.1 hypothetical protein [Altibacter sp. HG106]